MTSTQASPEAGQPSNTLSPHNNTSDKREKLRTTHACEQCRRLKTKCDGLAPCTRCMALSRGNACVYGVPVQRKPKPPRSTISRPLISKSVVPEKRKLTDPQALGEGSVPLPDRGHEELRAGVTALNTDTNAYQFYGASSHYSFIQRLYQRIRQQNDRSIAVETRNRVPEGLRQWGLEKHLFSRMDDGQKTRHGPSQTAYLPRELGDSFIATYFDIMHGQAPILERIDVERTWQDLRSGPGHSTHTQVKDNALLYMVFAIGARLHGAGVGDSYVPWSEHFFEEAGRNLADVFEETTLLDTQLLLLRGIYATQANKPNWIYL
jgi:hypothetical protein